MEYWRDKDGHVRDQDWQTDLLENILVTAVEGGINYWADVRVVKSGVEYLVSVDGVDVDDFVEDVRRNDGYVLLCQALVWDGLVRLSEADDLDEGCEAHRLSAGINKMFKSFGYDDESFMSFLDASGADVVVQYALFGEVIFG